MRYFWILIALLVVSITQAQDDTVTSSWEIVENCVGEPTAPPDDWSYDGTIIKWGHYGLHGINAEWETPRVLAFLPSYAHDDGAFSQDYRYFALVEQEYIQPIGYGTHLGGWIEVDGISIFDTTDDTLPIYEIDIENTYGVGNRNWSIRRLRWIDETHVVYETNNQGDQQLNLDYVTVIDITTHEQSSWNSPVNPLDNYFFYPSPNLRYAVRGVALVFSLFSIDTGAEILDDTALSNFQDANIGRVVWSQNSEAAVLSNYRRNPSTDQTEAIDILHLTVGGDITLVESIPTEQFTFPIIAISPDGQLVAYHVETLHIADLESQIIIDTCIETDILSLLWSPDGTQVAFTQRGRGQQPVNLYELNSERLYTIAYHNADTLAGWRED